MDMQVAEKLGLKPVGQGRKVSGLTIYEAQSLHTGMKWFVWCANKKSQGKLTKWYEAVSGLSVEGMDHLKCVDTSSGLWVAGAQGFGLPIAQYSPPDERRIGEVIYLTYRFLDALNQLERSGVPLRAEMFHEPCVIERAGLAPTLGFPGLYPLGNESADEIVSTRLVGRFLYVLLTGNPPPTEAVDVSSGADGERVGGFDSLLLDWVEEHTLDTGLGGLAMQAYEAEIDAESFAKAIYPHFEREAAQLVSDARRAAQEHGQLNENAETCRLRIQTLEERIAREEHWLKERSIEIESAERAMAVARDRLRQLEALEQGIAAQLGLEPNINFDLHQSAHLEAPLIVEAQDVHLPLAHNEDDIELDPDQLWPDAPKPHSQTRVIERPVNRVGNSDSSEAEPEVDVKPPLKLIPVFIFGLALGGFVVALALWFLGSTDTPKRDADLKPTIGHSLSKDSTSPAALAVQQRARIEAGAKALEKTMPVDAALVDSVDAALVDSVDANISKALFPANMEVDRPKTVVAQPPVALPSGMVRIAQGQVSTALSPLQAERLMSQCSTVFGAKSSRCTGILKEVDAQPSGRTVKAFGVDVTEVEFSAYQECVSVGVCSEPAHQWNKKNYPVTGVSATVAQRYCRWRDKRLPTNAEWMMAVRGEGQSIYPWGDVAPRPKQANLGAWSDEPVTDSSDGYRYVAPVASYQSSKSELGLLNLVGNVKELVVGDEGNGYFVKGAGYLSLGYQGRVTGASIVKSTTTATDIGFRCVIDL